MTQPHQTPASIDPAARAVNRAGNNDGERRLRQSMHPPHFGKTRRNKAIGRAFNLGGIFHDDFTVRAVHDPELG